jgi:hypothetical protein
MNSMTPMPELTGIDAFTQATAALAYAAVAAAALRRAPRDIRTRVFFVFALANVAAFAVPSFMWWKGIKDPASMPRAAAALMLAGLGVAALLLFHFSQVFPRRRPWIRTAGFQMAAGYVLIPLVIIAMVILFPANPGDISAGYVLGFLVFGFPLLVLLAVVLPVTAIMSLVRSYQEAGTGDLARARAPVAMILIGQIAGGALAVVFQPVLVVVAPSSSAQSALVLFIWLLGFLTPLAFALAVWKYDVLAIDAG